ncbi:MAG: hypothetical protein M1503_03335 [Thaumarchaeota archaeon]|nr:hypothetical protein [Nitrososphaerota archaeon]
MTEFASKGGLSRQGAAFLASTKLEVVSSNKTYYHFVEVFPTNTTADVSIRLTPGQNYTPTPAELNNTNNQFYNVKFTYSNTGNTYRFRLEYFVPTKALPPKLVESIKPLSLQESSPQYSSISGDKITLFQAPSQGNAVNIADEAGGQQSMVSVMVEATVNEAGNEFVSKTEEFLIEKGVGVEGQSPISTGASSILEVAEALNTRAEYQEWVKQLDALQHCAENPTNPLTIKAYAEDPGTKQKILDTIANARTELKANTAVSFLNKEVSVGSGLIGLPELSIAMAPATAYSEATLKQVSEDLVKSVSNMVTPCESPQCGGGAGGLGGGGGNVIGGGNIGGGSGNEGGVCKPGALTASYEGTVTITSAAGKVTLTDKGTISFTVAADGTVQGSGTGFFVYHLDGIGCTGDGQTSYSFTVGGMYISLWGNVTFQLTSVPTPYTLQITSNCNDQHKQETGTYPISAPMLIQNSVKLQSGSTVEEHSVEGQAGSQVSETRKLTIG